MKLLNLNYLRGLYDFLLDKSDGELESFDINSKLHQVVLFERMRRSFLKFGPIAKSNVVDGINFILANFSDDELWRSAVPHDLPLGRVLDRGAYLEGILFALTGSFSSSVNSDDFVLIDEIGPSGLDYSK